MHKATDSCPSQPITAMPTPGPYAIWCEDEQVPDVPCIEIGRGKIPSPEAKSLCLVQSTLDERTDTFVLTDEDWANARLFAAAPETAAERDRLVEDFERLRDAISDNLPGLSAIDDGTWHEYTGDLVLKEDQWNAIVAATRELRVALAGGEARTP